MKESIKSDDPFNLDRFVTAQSGVFDTALTELKVGRKRTHWIWFVFPQMRGLAHSHQAQFYGISGIDEARAYLARDVLGQRLHLSAKTVIESNVTSLHEMMGSPDDMKFRSSMTLFEAASEPGNIFAKALERWCEGIRDDKTLSLIAA